MTIPIRKLNFSDSGVLLVVARQSIAAATQLTSPLSAVVVVSDDELRSDECEILSRFYKVGCRLFAFVGPKSEASHDRFDDILQQDVDDVAMTTFHTEEPLEDTAAMLVEVTRRHLSPTMLVIDGGQQLTNELVDSIISVDHDS